MSAIQNFAFEEHLVRVVEQDGEPWFVGKDVCGALDLKNYRTSLDLLDDDEKGVHTMDTPGGNQEMIVLSEPGVYRLVFRSRKPEAERFKRWLAHDVIPQIRKTGQYQPALPQETRSEAGSTDLSFALAADRRQALAEVREARLIYGTMAARQIWEASPHLPQIGNAARSNEPNGSQPDEVRRALLEIILDDDMRNVREAVAAGDGDALEAIGIRLTTGGAWLLPRHPRLWPRWQATRWRDGHWVTMLKRLDDVTGGHERVSIGGHQGRPLWLPSTILT